MLARIKMTKSVIALTTLVSLHFVACSNAKNWVLRSDEVCGRLVECSDGLDPETLKILANCAPTDDEVSGIQNFLESHDDSTLNSLGKVDTLQCPVI